jgi:hypothetical protein
MAVPDLRLLDDDAGLVELDAEQARALWTLAEGFEAATVSACPECRSRVIAALALGDILDDAPPHPRAGELLELADDAPTAHLYVVDLATSCRHARWVDPGHGEWVDVVGVRAPRPRR